ncbi:hypothetical protein BUMB_05390c [Candidatus Paraburkholderia calva]|nr:hypothetical protein BUMB_05390c [Candidatus Paraburkholderia calva]
MRNVVRADKWSITLYHRWRDRPNISVNHALHVSLSMRAFLKDMYHWSHDQSFMVKLQAMLDVSEMDPIDARWRIKRALETGRIGCHFDLAEGASRQSQWQRVAQTAFYYVHAVAAILFKREHRATSNLLRYVSPTPPRLPANDGLAAWFARPGDMLPNGTIATALLDSNRFRDANEGAAVLLGGTQPIEFQHDPLNVDVLDVAGVSRGDMYACDIISTECKGSDLREFPSQYLDSKYTDIQNHACDEVKDARKAIKLLNDNRFKK